MTLTLFPLCFPFLLPLTIAIPLVLMTTSLSIKHWIVDFLQKA